MSKHHKFDTTEPVLLVWELLFGNEHGHESTLGKPWTVALCYHLARGYRGFATTVPFARVCALPEQHQWALLHREQHAFIDNEDQSDPENTLAALLLRLRAKFDPDNPYDYVPNTVSVDVALKHEAKLLRYKEQKERLKIKSTG